MSEAVVSLVGAIAMLFPSQAEANRLTGTWILTEVWINGKCVSEGYYAGVNFTANELRVEGDTSRLMYRIVNAQLGHLDLVPTVLCKYVESGGTLALCYNEGFRTRPETVDPKAGNVVFKFVRTLPEKRRRPPN
jgi:hypothetical protein